MGVTGFEESSGALRPFAVVETGAATSPYLVKEVVSARRFCERFFSPCARGEPTCILGGLPVLGGRWRRGRYGAAGTGGARGGDPAVLRGGHVRGCRRRRA